MDGGGMGGRMPGWTDGRMEAWMSDGGARTAGRTDGGMHENMGVWMGGSLPAAADGRKMGVRGWTVKPMNGWVGGRMHGRMGG